MQSRKKFTSNTLFLIAAALVLAIPLFFKADTIDLHIHDTMIVIGVYHFVALISLVFFAIYGLYRLLFKWLSVRNLSLLHAILTIVPIVFFLVMALDSSANHAIDESYWDPAKYAARQRVSRLITFSGLVCLTVGQLIFLFNLVVGLIKRQPS